MYRECWFCSDHATARVKVYTYKIGGGCARYLIRTGNWICSRSESPRSEDIPNSPRDPCARVLNVILERYRLEVAADRVSIHMYIYIPVAEEGRVREKRAVVGYTLYVYIIYRYIIRPAIGIVRTKPDGSRRMQIRFCFWADGFPAPNDESTVLWTCMILL